MKNFKSLVLNMKNGEVYNLPLDDHTEIIFKTDRICFRKYDLHIIAGNKKYALPETYYMDEIENMGWI